MARKRGNFLPCFLQTFTLEFSQIFQGFIINKLFKVYNLLNKTIRHFLLIDNMTVNKIMFKKSETF